MELIDCKSLKKKKIVRVLIKENKDFMIWVKKQLADVYVEKTFQRGNHIIIGKFDFKRILEKF